MEKLFVPYELALKLKEKGLNIKGLAHYGRNGRLYIEECSSDDGNCDAATYKCLAPLYQQVIDWFREKHDVDIFTNAHYKTDNSIAGYLFDVYDRREKYNTHKGCFESSSYYEARNKAIEGALKLI